MTGRLTERRNTKNMTMEQLLIDFLKPLIKQSVREAMTEFETEQKEQQPRFLTRYQVAEMLGVSLVTLHSYVNRGLLESKKIGNKTRFAEADVLKAIKSRKVYKFKHMED
jgi:excisionase family DNA binding protein